MSVYRAANIRLTETVHPQLAATCLPGPDASILGRYAQMRPQLAAFHAFDKAHVVMLTEQGLLSRQDAAAMLRVFRRLEADGAEAVRAATAENMHSGEALLREALGPDISGKLHLGRSSGDLLAVSFRMTLRDRLLTLMAQLSGLRQDMIDLAQRHAQTVMPGYTHLQHAQPLTFGHYLLSMLSGFDRDMERLRAFYARLNQSPAGAAILVGSAFALDRHRTADLLGFDALALNTRDAIWGRDLEIEAHALATILAGNINRLAEDLMLWSAPEYGMVECADGLCGTSSIMPQKKNPNGLEHLKGLVATASGLLVSAVVVNKNPSAVPVFEWIRALSDHWRSYDELIDGLPLMRAVLQSLRVHDARMQTLAGLHGATITDLAGLMVQAGQLSWRDAHQIAGIAVRLALEAGRSPADIDADMLDRAATTFHGQPLGLPAQDIANALDARASVARQQLPGGPAPARMAEALAQHAASLASDDGWLTLAVQRQADAATRLETAIDVLLQGEGQ